MGTVHAIPGLQLAPARSEHAGLHLDEDEVREASGGYRRPADQLKALHARGFVRAYIPSVGKKRVLLERAHHDAVVRGQFGRADPAQPDAAPAPPRANRARLERFFGSRGKK